MSLQFAPSCLIFKLQRWFTLKWPSFHSCFQHNHTSWVYLSLSAVYFCGTSNILIAFFFKVTFFHQWFQIALSRWVLHLEARKGLKIFRETQSITYATKKYFHFSDDSNFVPIKNSWHQLKASSIICQSRNFIKLWG